MKTAEFHLPGREYHSVRIERAPIRKLQSCLGKAGYLGVILEFNLPVYDQLARADICASRSMRSVTCLMKSGAAWKSHQSNNRWPCSTRAGGTPCLLCPC